METWVFSVVTVDSSSLFWAISTSLRMDLKTVMCSLSMSLYCPRLPWATLVWMCILSRSLSKTLAEASTSLAKPKELAARYDKSQFNFWCKSTTPSLLEIPGILITLIGSLAWIALQITVFPVYPRKGPWFHADPDSFPVSGAAVICKNVRVPYSVLLVHSKISTIPGSNSAFNRDLVHLQIRIPFSFLGDKDLRRFLLIMRNRSSLYGECRLCLWTGHSFGKGVLRFYEEYPFSLWRASPTLQLLLMRPGSHTWRLFGPTTASISCSRGRQGGQFRLFPWGRKRVVGGVWGLAEHSHSNVALPHRLHLPPLERQWGQAEVAWYSAVYCWLICIADNRYCARSYQPGP